MPNKLIIIGGGPAGLSAAINAASEGVDVSILDRAPALGGQFKESNDIENYPGVPVVTGATLSAAMIQQATQFGVDFCCPVSAAKIERRDGKLVVTSDDYEEREADAVLLALGLQWRRIEAPGVSELMGRGVTYGAPAYRFDKPVNVAIVGAGNSAGQQAVKMAQNPESNVYMIVRKTLAAQMSKYLIDQIAKLPNIEVIEGAQVGRANHGADGHLAYIETNGVDPRSIDVTELMIFIGGSPYTFWLRDQIELDEHKFIATDGGYHTSLEGVFAIGDARSGSCKRIGAAVGEGSAVIPNIHQYLASKEIK